MPKSKTYAMLHTCDHIMMEVLGKLCDDFQMYGLMITDEQVRFPFKAAKLSEEVTAEVIEDEVNRVIAENREVIYKKVPRAEAEKMDLDLSLVPKDSDEISLCYIGENNVQACIGPHVKNTKEIADYGRFKIIKLEKKGKDAYQITGTIEPKGKMKESAESTKSKPTQKIPRKLKGFNDFFAEDMKLRYFVIDTFRKGFEKYGYEPLETPALEYTELMLDQSGEEAEKQFYRFKDPGGRDVMLKFEVMISMCRAVAENLDKIALPYKRYQIQRTWRAENTQRGRYREFTQCDADTIGSSSMTCDAEFIQMGLEIVEGFGFKDFYVRISNRKFLMGLAEVLGIADDQFYGFCMSLDKVLKKGPEKVLAELVDMRGIPKEKARKAMEIVSPEQYEKLSFGDIIQKMGEAVGKSKVGAEGLQELSEIVEYLETVDMDPKYYRFDTSLARGLASYTGPVWEYEVVEGGVGSIGGCGRYDDAIGKYLGRDKTIPATGGSFGIERVSDILKDRKMFNFGKTTVDVLVTVFDAELWKESLRAADQLRKAGVTTMLYPEPAKIKKQFSYADKKGIPWVVTLGPDEVKSGKVQLKNMESGEQEQVTVEEVAKKIAS